MAEQFTKIEVALIEVALGKRIEELTQTLAAIKGIRLAAETTYYSVSADTLDKDIFKAKTNGLKYLFMQEFKLVTDDFIDTEQNGKHEQPETGKITDDQLDIINKLVKETSTDEKKFMAYVTKTFKEKELEKLSYVAGESLIANLNAKKDK